MKKVCMFLVVMALAIHMESYCQQKTGVLQKDHYGAFTGNDYESFMAGKNAAKFEAKSNIPLKDYLVLVENFVKNTLKEPSIEAAMQNSTVKDFPAGVKVQTHGIGGGDIKWFKRDAYDGEKGFYHTATGIYWLSFSCANLTAFRAVTPASTGTGTTTVYTPPSMPTSAPTSTGSTALASNGNNSLVLNTTTPEVPYSIGKAIEQNGINGYRLALYDGQALMAMNFQTFRAVEDANQCCGNKGVTTVSSAVQPAGNIYIREVATSGTTASTAGSQQIVVKTDHTFGETLTGGIISNAVGGFIANVGTQLVFGNRRSTGYYGQGFQSGTPIIRSGGPSQGGNPIAGGTSYTSTGGGLGPGSNGW